jgi:plasmid maintenance system killer protein
VDLHFRTRSVRLACESEQESARRWGAEHAAVVRRRIAELRAAETLAVVSVLPHHRLHSLPEHGDGQFAIYVRHPARLIFEPWQEEIPQLAGGGVDITGVTAIRILDIENDHGR